MFQDILPKEIYSEAAPTANKTTHYGHSSLEKDRMAYSQHRRRGRRRGAATAAWPRAPSCSLSMACTSSLETQPRELQRLVCSVTSAGTLSEPVKGGDKKRRRQRRLDFSLFSPVLPQPRERCPIGKHTHTHTLIHTQL